MFSGLHRNLMFQVVVVFTVVLQYVIVQHGGDFTKTVGGPLPLCPPPFGLPVLRRRAALIAFACRYH